ncbi:hypothetical protein BZA05DRAFT_475466 [Tricharina praecox]|uniref:uncharacterized protein n=1 Tax=Tricharina praecox TaxID=43433 RepID=UPI00221FC43A|nr:uncharacterized protein BZA05DRAFT_475466 [Tricharina praecox]KAI5848418.1 hypothetical protein BZA05DRAFT_475466 [Tricharina praecox]
MSACASYFSSFLPETLAKYFTRNRTFLTLLLTPHLLHRLYGNYTLFHSLGPSGVPRNPIGWAISSSLKLVTRETLSTTQYSLDGPAYLAPLPARAGERPTKSWHPVPQRQITQLPSEDVIEAVQSALLEIHAEFYDVTEQRTSEFEKHGQALFVKKDVPDEGVSKAVVKTKREVAHVHETDGSVHVVMSSHADCRDVVEKGWGERHPLAGVVLEKEYLMIYAPRDWDEVNVVRGILEAAVRGAVGKAKPTPGQWN